MNTIENQHEILFRGFSPCANGDTTIYDKGTAFKGRWVEGLLLKSVDDTGTHFEIQTWREVKDEVSSRLLDVLPSTICRYTGLLDKNGKKIFEGDVVKFGEYQYTVEWKTDRLGYGYFESADRMLEDDGKHCEVIGTIWDKEGA